MRKALRRQAAPMAQTARSSPIQAPTGGWDTQSALANMKPDRAPILDNWIPRPGYIEARRGSAPQITGLGPVQTLMTWRGSASGDKLLACVAGSIYDVTDQGPGLTSPIYSGATVATWQNVNFANDAGTWVIAVNGTDTPIKYEGTTVTTTAITGSSGPITLDPTKLFDVTAHKHFLHFAEADSLHVWFLAVNAIAGPAGLLDLGPVFTKGGQLACMGTWSFNTGQTLDDFIAYVTTQGQVAIFQGTDPGDATLWSLVGVYDVGFPLSVRSLVKFGSELCLLTTDGVVPLSQALKLDRSQDNLVALTQRIQPTFLAAQQAYRSNFGWQGIIYERGALAIFNVPSTPAVQFVQNLQNGSWCRFTGLDALCWATANDMIYFGNATGVYQWDTGPDDLGLPIIYDVKGAFSAYGARGVQKKFQMLRPLMVCPGFVAPAVEVDVDYRESIPTAVPTVANPGDMTAQTRYDWASVSGIGFVGAPRMRISISGPNINYWAVDSADVDTLQDGDGNDILTDDPIPDGLSVQLTGFDVLWEPGGIL